MVFGAAALGCRRVGTNHTRGAPCTSVCGGTHRCVCLITVSSSPTTGRSLFSVWLKRDQRFGSSLSALLEGQINGEIFPISLNLFGKSSCFQMEKVSVPPDFVLLIRYWSVCLPVQQFFHLNDHFCTNNKYTIFLGYFYVVLLSSYWASASSFIWNESRD